MALIKGITILLYEKVKSGVDGFNNPVYTETPVEVENVLVSPVNTAEIMDNTQLDGKRLEYELCIPKGDTHSWEDRIVEFFGQRWKTFGMPLEYIEANLPLDWNKKVKVKRYG